MATTWWMVGDGCLIVLMEYVNQHVHGNYKIVLKFGIHFQRRDV